jgi:hypothetical protein
MGNLRNFQNIYSYTERNVTLKNLFSTFIDHVRRPQFGEACSAALQQYNTGLTGASDDIQIQTNPPSKYIQTSVHL